MKIEVSEEGNLLLKEVFGGIELESPDGDEFSILMFDEGFEFFYNNKWWEAKEGIVKRLGS